MFCEQCGAKNEDKTKFCITCGAKMPIDNNVDSEANVEYNHSGNMNEAPKNKGEFKKIITGVVLIAVVAALVYGGINIFKGSNSKTSSRDRSKDPIIYVKSSQLMVRANGKKTSYVAADGNDYQYGNIFLTIDGKTMFFADDPSGNSYKLYYRKVDEETPKGKDADSKGIRIASGVSDFTIQKDGKFVLYRKDDRLYYSDLKEERSISSDVSFYIIGFNEKKVVFTKSDGNLYMCGFGKKDEPEKIDSEISNVIGWMEKNGYLYYTKDSSLYQMQYGKEKDRIARDIESAAFVGNQIYVTKRDEVSDAAGFTLYKVVGNDLEKVTDGLIDSHLSTSNYNYGEYVRKTNAVVFRKMAENNSEDESDNTTQSLYIIQGDNPPFKAMDIDINSTGAYKFSSDGKYFYIIEELSKSGYYGDLIRYSVGLDSLSDKIRICDSASDFTVHGEDVVVTSNINDKTTLGLYTSGKYTEISDETGRYYRYMDGALYYLDDYSNNKNIGNLMRYKNGKAQKIDIDVYSMDVRGGDDVVYIKDYSTRRGYGDLYQKKGNRKSYKVDTDVSYIVTIY